MRKTITMPCADDAMSEREFESNGEFDSKGRPDYTCTRCGWMQTSAAGGAAELCAEALWHDMDEYRKYAQIARDGGYEVPDTPPRFEP